MNDQFFTRIAILGCGAVTELGHLPALRHVRNARITLLIDSNSERRERLATAFDVERTHSNGDGCCDHFDAAIVALPIALRGPACIKLLAQRKAVFVEPPMALSVDECDTMIHAAERAGTTLAVGLMRRFLWAHRLARLLIKSEALGRIESFDFRDGSIHSSAAVSDLSFQKESDGGGVLVDAGVHTIDCLLHWLGEFSEVEYFDDAEGGVEANCLLNLRLQNGTEGVVELSRTRRLRNTAIIRCERGVIEVGLDRDHENYLKLTFHDQPYVLGGQVSNLKVPDKRQVWPELLALQIEDFIDAARTGRKPEADGQSAKSSIRLVETCYRHRKPLQLPWMRYETKAPG